MRSLKIFLINNQTEIRRILLTSMMLILMTSAVSVSAENAKIQDDMSTVVSSAVDTSNLSPVGRALRSLIVPGWGQWQNGKKFKASGVLLYESLFAGLVLHRDHKFSQTGDSQYRQQRNTFQWWLALGVVVSIVDAYVDAHLDRFETDLDITHLQDISANQFMICFRIRYPLVYFNR